LNEAIRLYKLAVEQGIAQAHNNLAACYQHGNGIDANMKEATRLYKLSADAQNNLAVCYEHGNGVEKNLNEAIRLYKLSVEQGCAPAQNNLAMCYEDGNGVERDFKEAFHLYKLSDVKRNIHRSLLFLKLISIPFVNHRYNSTFFPQKFNVYVNRSTCRLTFVVIFLSFFE